MFAATRKIVLFTSMNMEVEHEDQQQELEGRYPDIDHTEGFCQCGRMPRKLLEKGHREGM